jgi:hypothetical protein
MNTEEHNRYRQNEPRLDEIIERLDIVDGKIPELREAYLESGHSPQVLDKLLSSEKESSELHEEKFQIWNKIKTG